MCEYINNAIIQEDFTMKKTIYDKNNGLWYELRSDYYIPCLTVPAHEDRPIGIWGQRMNNIRDRVMEIVDHDLIYA